jgi:type III restriction enzyme
MPTLSLKTYQLQALDSLRRFLAGARNAGSLTVAWAQEMQRQQQPAAVQALPYRTDPFGPVPCVCLRIPTGGGKTLLAAHAIELAAREWRLADHPVVLWLVPSSTIRDQTLRALQQPGHAYRAALEAAYGQALMALDLDAAPTIAPQDFGHKTIVLVATMQSFRVRQTQGRNVYAFSEEFDPHFRHFAGHDFSALERVTQADLDEAGASVLGAGDLGRVKHSLANLLALARPIVIVDEAHNAKTDTTFATLKRVAPCLILELTATPVPKKTNVLYSVSARELQAEEMVKLPVMLAEHKSWTDAVRDAVLRRRQLEGEAAHEAQYLRPIVLFQAQDKTGEVNPEVLRQHLIDEKHATADEIVVATGDQRGLDGIDLFDPACKVRHVITVEALKEGWDCSFAYVLCSLQNVRSGKDVEQLLGRVLRMPYATRRKSQALNRSYAHVLARSFSEAAAALVDRMVTSMGFEALDAATALLPDPGVPDLFGDAAVEPLAPPVPRLELDLPAAASDALRDDPDIEVHAVQSSDAAGRVRVSLRGEVSDAQLSRLMAAAPAALQPSLSAQVLQHNDRVAAARAPAQRGVAFPPLPLLCLHAPGADGNQGEFHLFERDTLDEVVAFDLLRADPRPNLPGFAMVEQSDLFEIDVGSTGVVWRHQQDAAQLSLDAVPASASEDDLRQWLAQALRRDAVSDAQMRRWIVVLLAHLQQEQGFTLTALVRARHALATAAMRRIDALLAQARSLGFQQLTLAGSADTAAGWRIGVSPAWQFSFQPGRYPARHAYAGRYRFNKHYYEVIHDLKASGEEFDCAKVLDSLPQVKHWVRNIERQPLFSFWLPTATDYFYPDFVAELADGRLLVVEYKGDAYATNDDSREKRAIGVAWARASGSQKAIFVMVEKAIDGLDARQQLRAAINA